MKDRIVEYPNRYKLIAVAGQDGVYDLEAVPGTITENGTPINKASLLAEGVDKNFCLDSGGTVSEALKRTPMWSSYLAFVGNVNTDQLDAAFGKNNEDRISGVGPALAMYARYKNPSIDIETDFPALIQTDSFLDMCGIKITQLYENTLTGEGGRGSNATTDTVTLTITQEMLNKTKSDIIYLKFNIVKNNTGLGYETALTVTLNGEDIVPSTPLSYGYPLETKMILDLAAANITMPGNYDFVVSMQGNNNNAYNTTISYELQHINRISSGANFDAMNNTINNNELMALINSSTYASDMFYRGILLNCMTDEEGVTYYKDNFMNFFREDDIAYEYLTEHLTVLTGEGEYVVPNNRSALLVLMIGGGGSGGMSKKGTSSSKAGSAGGGGAGWITQEVLSVTPGTSISYSAGAGGAVNSSGSQLLTRNGYDGGTTTFGSISASGGGGGEASETNDSVSLGGTGSAKGGDSNGPGNAINENLWGIFVRACEAGTDNGSGAGGLHDSSLRGGYGRHHDGENYVNDTEGGYGYGAGGGGVAIKIATARNVVGGAGVEGAIFIL